MNEAQRYRIYLCGGSHCTAQGRERLRTALADLLWQQGIDTEVLLADSGCQGHCEQAPNLVVWPGAERHTSLDVETLRDLAARLAERVRLTSAETSR